MRPDEANIRAPDDGCAVEDTRNRDRRVVRKLASEAPPLWQKILTALRAKRMRVDDRLAPIELVHHRHEGRVTWVLAVMARHHADAVSLQRVHRVLDFLERAIDVGQR